MDFIKKHYEKVLLGVVLLGLVVGAAFLPLMIAGERQSLEDKSHEILTPKIKPLSPPGVSRAEDLIKRTESPLSLELAETNRLFNPLRWQRTAQGSIVPIPAGSELNLCKITKITPLYTIITLDNVQTNGPIRYLIGIVRNVPAANPTQRPKRQSSALLREKRDKEGYTIQEVRGPAENPTELVLELADTGERAVMARDKDKPSGPLVFRREDGYMANLRYDPERWSRTDRREGDRVAFGGESYIIVAIHKNEVTLQAESNKKKTPIPYNPGQ